MHPYYSQGKAVSFSCFRLLLRGHCLWSCIVFSTGWPPGKIVRLDDFEVGTLTLRLSSTCVSQTLCSLAKLCLTWRGGMRMLSCISHSSYVQFAEQYHPLFSLLSWDRICFIDVSFFYQVLLVSWLSYAHSVILF